MSWDKEHLVQHLYWFNISLTTPYNQIVNIIISIPGVASGQYLKKADFKYFFCSIQAIKN